MVTLLLTVGLVLGAGTQAEARCYDVGTPQFRCDPIVFQALRQRVESRPAYPLPRRSRFELNSYSTTTGATRQTYRYSDGCGHERQGEILELPSGAVLHRGERSR